MQKLEFKNIKFIVSEIEKKFPVDPIYRNWKGRGEINIRCPYCPDKKYHLGLSFRKNAFNCFRCPASGKLTDFLKKHNINYNSEVRISSPQVKTKAFKLNIPKDFKTNWNYYNIAKNYLKERGFYDKFIFENFQLWPITDQRHYYFGYIIVYLNEYAFYARKYLKTKEFELKNKHIIRKSDSEMKLFYAYEKNNSDTILVVESMFNLMRATQFGFDAVCIFGKEKWQSLVEYLRNRNNESNLCLCFDKDVKIDNIISFIKRIQKSCGNMKISYIDPKTLPFNDIAIIRNRDLFIKLIQNRKNIDEIFLDIFDLGDKK